MIRSPKSVKRAPYAAGMFDGLVIDLFAGGGGASMGIEQAIGRAVDAAVNHDPDAVAMHRVNHPHTIHYCESVFRVKPHDVTGGRPVEMLWASPDCKHFSRAKGAKPVEKKIRGLAHVVVRWAERVRPRVIFLENVREFETWGPLRALWKCACGWSGEPKDMPANPSGIRVCPRCGGSGGLVKSETPCPLRKGKTFRLWVAKLRRLGYTVEWRTLDAADFGAPTHRKRLFLVARCDGEPVVWPEPTHGPGRSRKYRTAAECIDWSLPTHSIFLTKEEARAVGVNRPLAPKTMRRIALGLKRFVLDNPKPFIVKVNHGGGDFRGQPVDSPLATITGKHGTGIVAPGLINVAYGEKGRWGDGVLDVNNPLGTIHAGGKNFAAVSTQLAPYMTRICQNGSNGACVQGVDRPLSTIVSKGEHCLTAASLIQYNQEKGAETRGKGLNEPINVVPTENRHALVSTFLSKHYGGVVGHTPDRPIGTVTSVDHHSVAAANLIHMNHGDKQWSTPDGPLRTVLAGANHHGLVCAFLTKHLQGPPDEGNRGRKNSGRGRNATGRSGRNGLEMPDARQPGSNHEDRTETDRDEVEARLPTGSAQDSRPDLADLGTPPGVGHARGADSSPHGHQSHRRKKGQQPPRQPGAGDEIGEPAPRDPDGPAGRALLEIEALARLAAENGGGQGQGGRTAPVRGELPGDPKADGGGGGSSVSPLQESGGELTAAWVSKYFGTGGVGQSATDPLHTITAKDRFGVVTVAGLDYAISDIGLRMLTPRELFRCQGFPESYVIDLIVAGKGKPRRLPKNAQTRMVGNSVCPQVARALVAANHVAGVTL